MTAAPSIGTEGHFVALTLCAGSDVKQLGEFVSPGVTFRDWVQRKITQHLALPCSETTRWVAHYRSTSGQVEVSPDVHDIAAAQAMRALSIAVMTVTVTHTADPKAAEPQESRTVTSVLPFPGPLLGGDPHPCPY